MPFTNVQDGRGIILSPVFLPLPIDKGNASLHRTTRKNLMQRTPILFELLKRNFQVVPLCFPFHPPKENNSKNKKLGFRWFLSLPQLSGGVPKTTFSWWMWELTLGFELNLFQRQSLLSLCCKDSFKQARLSAVYNSEVALYTTKMKLVLCTSPSRILLPFLLTILVASVVIIHRSTITAS